MSGEIITVEATPVSIATSHYQTMVEFVKLQMSEGTDYGIIPNTNGKPTLLKPGAEKLCRLFNLSPTFEIIHSITDFDKPLFHYHYRCTLYRHGEVAGQGEGCCNSKEKKYEKQQYKVFDLTNTIVKIAQKRAMVAAVLVVAGASEFFTQDIEDFEPEIKSAKAPEPKVNTDLLDATTSEIKRLGWSGERGKVYLKSKFGKAARSQLTESELQQFLNQLKAMPTPALQDTRA